MRYKNTKISNIGGKLSYDTTYYPNIPIQDSDQLKYFPRGTRFDKIAFDTYGDTSLWWIITKANEVSNADIQVDVQKQYRIPTDIANILSEFRKLNT